MDTTPLAIKIMSIRAIETKAFRIGVNCYLLETGLGYVLIDSGWSAARSDLDTELLNAGCKPGMLSLIIQTHGDLDHAGNAAYLRNKHAAKIAIHEADAGMVERGDMSWNRKANPLVRILFSLPPGRLSKEDRFSPDILLANETDLAGYGLDARVVYLPGHSKGSIGILTTKGDLFCGDLLTNTGKPALNSIMDDKGAGAASLEKVRSLGVRTIHPGHGKSFPADLLPDAPTK
ncbi:MAG TPA: MBL fold metallo-hydrolase [Aggregatilineales bacterium]|nr:MBL fold metallo-hydrolase [Aggregatilineales bacterium]